MNIRTKKKYVKLIRYINNNHNKIEFRNLRSFYNRRPLGTLGHIAYALGYPPSEPKGFSIYDFVQRELKITLEDVSSMLKVKNHQELIEIIGDYYNEYSE